LSLRLIRRILSDKMRTPVSSRKRLQFAGRILLVLALLIARGGAVTHAYSHLANDPPSLPTQTCGDCLSFAPMLAVVGGSAEPPLIEHRTADELAAFTAFTVACASRPSPFQSRAPPTLL
jgi:disulfide bond formation protein DsbB